MHFSRHLSGTCPALWALWRHFIYFALSCRCELFKFNYEAENEKWPIPQDKIMLDNIIPLVCRRDYKKPDSQHQVHGSNRHLAKPKQEGPPPHHHPPFVQYHYGYTKNVSLS